MGYSTEQYYFNYIILIIQQEQYHIVSHLSGIVFTYYGCQKSELYYFNNSTRTISHSISPVRYCIYPLWMSKVRSVFCFTHLKLHKRLSGHNLEYHLLLGYII